MFDIKKLVLFNFKSYRGKHVINFPTAAGLYFIKGESDLGGNGAGKSTILDAIVWGLYGSTPSGLKAGDIINRGQNTAHVEVHLTVGGRELQILRQQSPNKLILNGKHVVQDDIDKILRFNKDAFTYSVIAPQGGQSFFKLKPGEKLALFSQIMDLEFWMERSAAADTRSKGLERQITALTAHIEASTTILENTTAEVESLSEKADGFNKERKQTIKLLESKMHEATVSAEELEAKASTLDEGIGNWITKLEDQETSAKRQGAARDSHMEKQRALDNKQAVLQNRLKALEQAADKFERLGATCPTCNQAITSSHLKAEKANFAKEAAALRTELREAEKAFNDADAFRVKIDKNLANAEGLITTYKFKITDLERSADQTEAAAKAKRAEADRLVKEILAERARKNPYAEILKDKEETIVTLSKQLKDNKQKLEEASAQYAAVNYWVKGFKRVRLFLIDETLRTLELEVNNCLTSLGMPDWSIEFDVERENKSGGVTKGFTVLVRNPTQEEPIKYESWSGGEAQRLQLAGDLGLANLIMTQAGVKSSIEFFDEPSNYLSPDGLRDLAETLQQRALNEEKMIFLIDHHTYEFGEFSATYTVTKDKDGSHFGAG